MVQPNNACIGFCNWMLNVSAQRLSGPQRVIVEDVLAAAIANTPVSDQVWYNFNLFTAWRNRFYKVYRDYASVVAPDLLTGLIASYNMEVNINDALGVHNGTPVGLAFNAPAGKILNGCQLAGLPSYATFAGIPMGLNGTVGMWLRPNAGALSPATILFMASPIVNFSYDQTVQRLQLFDGTLTQFATVLSTLAMQCVVLRYNSGVASLLVNDVADPVTKAVVSAPNWGFLGFSNPAVSFNGDIDILNVWDRPLSDVECSQFFNAGAGLQYPF